MALVTLPVGGRRYELACRAGEEAKLLALAELVDRKANDAAQVVGTTNEARQLLLAALLLADELSDIQAGAPDPSGPALARTLESLSERIEILAGRLEKSDRTS
jgi:cell division protein ZapA